MKTNRASILLFAGAMALLPGCAFGPSQPSYADLSQARPEPANSKTETTTMPRAELRASATTTVGAERSLAGEVPEPAPLDVPPFGLRMPESTPVNHNNNARPLTLPGDVEMLKTPPAPAEAPAITDFSTSGRQPFTLSPDEQLNRVNLGKFHLTGPVAESYKARNPLQVLNPFAVRDLGSVEGNLTRDPTSGKISGLKLFSFDF